MTAADKQQRRSIQSRGTYVRRMLSMAFLLTKTPLTVNELAKYFDVHKKTVRRDLDVLREIGVRIYSYPQPHESWRLRVPKNFVQRILEK